jgi:hypothetical protein
MHSSDHIVAVISLIGEYVSDCGYTTENVAGEGSEEFENEVFLIRGFDWDDNYDAPNFWYKPDNIQVYWHKYVGRSTESNDEYDVADSIKMLNACIDSLANGS